MPLRNTPILCTTFNAGVEEHIENVVSSNDLCASIEAAKPLLFNSGIRTAEGGANEVIIVC